MPHRRESIPEQQLAVLWDILFELKKQTPILLQIAEALTSEPTLTPTAILFRSNTMALVAGTTAVFTGTLSPAGSAYPAGTTFTVTTTDPTVTATVDSTGLIVSLDLPATFVDDPANPFSFTYTTSTFVPVPSTSPSVITQTVTPSIPTATPTAISFVQTS